MFRVQIKGKMKAQINLRPILPPPDLCGKITTSVYFTAGGKLWLGHFHKNGCFYAHTGLNDMVIANHSGRLTNFFGEDRGECLICEGWAYSDAIKIENAPQPAGV